MNETFVFFALAFIVLALLIYGLLPVFIPKRTKQDPATAEPVLEKNPTVPPAEHQAPLVSVAPKLSPVINIPQPKPKPIPPPPPESSPNQPERLEELGGLPAFDGLCVACRLNPMDSTKTTFLCEPCANLSEFSSFESNLSVNTPEIELPPATGTPALTPATTPSEEIQEPQDDESQEIPITSSTIRGVWYYPEHKVLHLRLTDDSVFRYFMVPEKVFNDFLTADSKDAYFHSNIRGTYHNKMDKAPTALQNKTHKTGSTNNITEAEVRPGFCPNHPDVPVLADGSGVCFHCDR